MTSIKLQINPHASDFNSLHITVNNQPVEYLLIGNTVQLICAIDMGIHQLSIRLNDGNRICIDDVIINSAGLRQTLYLSYIKTDTGEIQQPATVLWEKTQTWILPFGNPVSYWISLVNTKLPASALGQDLSKKYNILYPCKIKLQKDCLPVVKDFFEHNFDFFCKPKEATNFLPQRKTNLDISKYNIQAVLDEIEKNWQLVLAKQSTYAQKLYNDRELPLDSNSWINLLIFINGNFVLEPNELPLLQQLISDLPINNIKKSYIGILPPGAVIAPHMDNVGLAAPGDKGCNMLYMPLRWPPGNYFKFCSGGLIDSADTWLINTSDHVHALINESNQTRIILSVILDLEQNLHLIA